ncbi:hypothetical protein PILCRDRAFT_4739 [Piloderma croceum F 1598]|uniref:Uncharacterized protein n=1 Tax=Piloderma croceum (strain F 1598) TaxID=765440 RepID=A0A0C3G2X2_PILCF|nr:hypothetical protein PILCRDRAFT_4739 [Piloderma croceum F 1598]
MTVERVLTNMESWLMLEWNTRPLRNGILGMEGLFGATMIIAIVGKLIFEDLAEFVREMKYLERLEVTYGLRELVTPHVRGLLPQNNDAVLQQRAAYLEEVQKDVV